MSIDEFNWIRDLNITSRSTNCFRQFMILRWYFLCPKRSPFLLILSSEPPSMSLNSGLDGTAARMQMGWTGVRLHYTRNVASVTLAEQRGLRGAGMENADS